MRSPGFFAALHQPATDRKLLKADIKADFGHCESSVFPYLTLLGWAAYVRFVAALTIILVYFASSGAVAGEQPPGQNPAQLITRTLGHEGIERTFHINLPPGFDKKRAAPLVLALHGGGGEGRMFDQKTTAGTLTVAAAERGVVLVFPEGVDKHWNDGRPEIFGDKFYDDVGFIAKVIDTMSDSYGIDPTRVYATGISNGGFMSVRLAMDLSERITAIAPVSAQISMALKDRTPAIPVSIMIVNGTDDPLVPFDGGHIRLFKFGRSRGEVLSTASSIEHFVRHNHCSQAPEIVRMPDKDEDDGTTVLIESYTKCRDETAVVLAKVIGGGHTWPGGSQYLNPRIVGVVCNDINASELILDFFLKHSRHGSELP